MLAAKRNGIKTVLIPKDNEIDLKEIQDRVKEGMKIVPISRIEEAIPYIFQMPKIKKGKSKKKNAQQKKKKAR